MRKHNILTGAIVISGGLFAATSLADTDEKGSTQEKGMHEQSMYEQGTKHDKSKGLSFQELDRDGDGYISQSEFDRVNVEKRIDHASLDQDGDGQLDQTEFAAFERLASEPEGQQGMMSGQSGYSESTGDARYGEQSDPARGTEDSGWDAEESTGDDY